MLLETLEKNRAALMRIGHEAVERGGAVGLVPSCGDLKADKTTESGDAPHTPTAKLPARVARR